MLTAIQMSGYDSLTNRSPVRMTIPPNALAAAAIWITAWLSTRYNIMTLFMLGSIGIAIIGFHSAYVGVRLYHPHYNYTTWVISVLAM